jgi:hypothetical protein
MSSGELRRGLHPFKYFSENLSHIKSVEVHVPFASALLFKQSALLNNSEPLGSKHTQKKGFALFLYKF